MVDVQEREVRAGDLFLLCSDGLTTMLNDAEIRAQLRSEEPLDVVCRGLVRAANARGGLDNVTVLLAKVESAEENPEE